MESGVSEKERKVPQNGLQGKRIDGTIEKSANKSRGL